MEEFLENITQTELLASLVDSFKITVSVYLPPIITTSSKGV